MPDSFPRLSKRCCLANENICPLEQTEIHHAARQCSNAIDTADRNYLSYTGIFQYFHAVFPLFFIFVFVIN